VRLDLHLHTTRSDGAFAPEAVAAAAARAGLHAIAITDHDTADGVAPARAAAAREGRLRVLAGIELSCTEGGADLHLLGYGIDPADPGLSALAARLAVLRRERLGEIVARLNALGVAIGVTDVSPPAGNLAVGRPHVAEALVRLGSVSTVQEAFGRFLRDGGPAHVPHRGPAPADAIRAVHDAGGVAVWAHPGLEAARRFPEFRGLGLDGVEALRPTLAPTASAAMEHAARAAGLFITGGSDWHGAARPALGSWYVTEKHVPRLLARLGISTD
jgi:hypothetical protein